MRREFLASLLSSAATTPWAMRREVLEQARASLLGGGVNLAGLTIPDGLNLAADLTEPVGFAAAGTAEPEAALDRATERAVARKPGGVAVIPVRGTIASRVSIFDLLFGSGVTPPGWIVQRVRQAVEDEAVKAVVLDFDSPGGVVTGVQEASAAILAMRGKKPIVAQVSGQCASAAYWIAASADEIAATETALVGSIGVYMLHEDWSKLYEEIGVKFTFVQEGDNKTEASEYEPLSQEAFNHLKEMVGDYMDMFVNAVAKGRGVNAATVRGDQFGRGRVYTAARAVERGMADKVRDLSGTLAAFGVNPNAPGPEASRGRALGMMRLEVDALL